MEIIIILIFGFLLIQAVLWFMVPFFINTMNNNIQKIVEQLNIVCKHCEKDLPEEEQIKYTTDAFGNKIADGLKNKK